MTIPDYGALLADAGEYAGRNDVEHLFPRFVGLAELKFNRTLRTGDMEKVAIIELTDGEGALPEDFLEVRRLRSPSGQVLRAHALETLSARYGERGGSPEGYAIIGAHLQVRPRCDGDLTLEYYAKVPPLTPASPVNWLLAKAPDAYLYGLVEEISVWERDAGKAGAAQGLKTLALAGLASQDERARWGNAQLVVGGQTP